MSWTNSEVSLSSHHAGLPPSADMHVCTWRQYSLMAWEAHPWSGAAPSPDEGPSTEHGETLSRTRALGSKQQLAGHDSRNTVQSQFVGMALNAVHTEHVQ